MASIYRKQKSPFWFVQFIDTDGTRRNKSTGLRADNPGETVKARALRAPLERWNVIPAVGNGWRSGFKSGITIHHAPSPTATPLNTLNGAQATGKKQAKRLDETLQ